MESPCARIVRMPAALLAAATRIMATGVAGFLLASALPGSASQPAPAGPSALASPLPDCPAGARPMLYSAHPQLDARTAPGFADTLRRRLQAPLGELGYCLAPIPDYRALLDTARHGSHLVLHALVPDGPQDQGPANFVIAVLGVRDWNAGKLPEAVSRPLTALPLHRDDPAGLADVLVRKVAENLRRQYVAHLMVQSRPTDAAIRTAHGLQGRTPAEWILPLGPVSLAVEKPGYLPLRRDLDLASPGLHTYDLQLTRRRFWHSRFIWPAAAFGAAAVAAYAAREHYYAEYQGYGPREQAEDPGIFAETFRTAKNCERAAAGALVLAGTSLLLSFRF